MNFSGKYFICLHIYIYVFMFIVLQKLLDGLKQVTDPWDKQHKKILIFVSKVLCFFQILNNVIG